MSGTKTNIQTKDGVIDAYVAHPDGAGSWPAVLVFMDGLGWRPALFEIADRLASNGYYALLPNMFWRSGEFEPFDPKTVFAGGPEMERLMKIITSVTNANAMSDTETCLDFLADRPEVKDGRKIACTGYCMGGRLALSAAGHFPDRFAAAASYHGGGLATDSPDSPHRLAPAVKARVYVGAAIEDRGFDDAQKQRLEDALTDAGVAHTIETYQARHGWVPRDTPVHDAAATERHWQTLLGLLQETM
jgi:carboxymethylenebutenolidase